MFNVPTQPHPPRTKMKAIWFIFNFNLYKMLNKQYFLQLRINVRYCLDPKSNFIAIINIEIQFL